MRLGPEALLRWTQAYGSGTRWDRPAGESAGFLPAPAGSPACGHRRWCSSDRSGALAVTPLQVRS